MRKLSHGLSKVPLHYLLGFVASLVVAAFLLLLKIPQPPDNKRNDSLSSSVELSTSADAILLEKSSLQDPTPLFLPTALNSTQAVHPENSLHEPGDSYQVQPKLVFGNDAVPLLLPAPVELPGKPADELARTVNDRPFPGFGQRESHLVTFSKRDAIIEVIAAENGERLLSMPIQDVTLKDNDDWRPCEFFVETDATGLLGEPPMISSSGVEKIDQTLHNLLVSQWALIERKAKLPVGAYRILLGP